MDYLFHHATVRQHEGFTINDTISEPENTVVNGNGVLNILANVGVNVGANVGQKSSKIQDRIIELMKQNNAVTVKEIAESLGITPFYLRFYSIILD